MATNTNYGDLIKDSFETYIKGENLVPLLLGFIVAVVVSIFSLGIAAPAMFLGYTMVVLRIARGEKAELGDVFAGFQHFVPALLLGIIAVVAIMLGLIALFIGSVVVAFLLSYSMFFLADDPQIGPVEALKASFHFVKDNLSDALIVFIIAMAIGFVAGLIPVVGGLVAQSFSTLMLAKLYLQKTRASASRPAVASAL